MNVSEKLIRVIVVAAFICVCAASAFAEPLTLKIAAPAPAQTEGFKMGTARSPSGHELTLDSHSLRLDGQPWTPVMGEFHYSRYPENEWRDELLKMKAGGVDIVSTYVFWIHHEEVEGVFDWSGRRSLQNFVKLCGEVGLKVVVRCGPWCHGEVRNGGLPDWVQAHKDWKLRSTDTNFLAVVKILYGEIAKQLSGQLWKDGGPVIGIQFDNEFHGPASYLLALKKIALEAGLDVPLYTKTGWPELTTPLPRGEIIPLYGNYAEGFWDRPLTPMPNKYWKSFIFSNLRAGDVIGTDQLGQRDTKENPEATFYPYLTCEIGGGMPASYHRRILPYPEDSESLVLIQIGSGSVLPGYYMYQGGVNPEGKLSTLQESQATGYWNDLPVKTYDFYAPLGEYGQIRPHYDLLRRIHLFLHDFGSTLATMPTYFPPQPTSSNDISTLRWSVRSDGKSGFVFVNNYQRLLPMPPKTNVQFALQLPDGQLIFPAQPVNLPADSCFIWPFNLQLGYGVKLTYATAQPICTVDDGKVRTVFFAETPGVPAEFVLENLKPVKAAPRRTSTMRLGGTDGGIVQIVLLDQAESLALWKGEWQGRERAFLTHAGLMLDGDNLRLNSTNLAALNVGIFPGPASLKAGRRLISGKSDGLFDMFTPPAPKVVSEKATFQNVQSAGPARVIPFGKIKSPVAAAPEDSDFAQAGVWKIKLPPNIDLATDPILRLHYVGDAARFSIGGKFITDNFYNGREFDIGLRRHAPDILKDELRVAILPLRKDAPIYLANEAKLDFGAAESIVDLKSVEIVKTYEVRLKAGDSTTSR